VTFSYLLTCSVIGHKKIGATDGSRLEWRTPTGTKLEEIRCARGTDVQGDLTGAALRASTAFHPCRQVPLLSTSLFLSALNSSSVRAPRVFMSTAGTHLDGRLRAVPDGDTDGRARAFLQTPFPRARDIPSGEDGFARPAGCLNR
jgi:hypothetical protein